MLQLNNTCNIQGNWKYSTVSYNVLTSVLTIMWFVLSVIILVGNIYKNIPQTNLVLHKSRRAVVSREAKKK